MILKREKTIHGYLEFIIQKPINEPMKKASNPATELIRFESALIKAKEKIELTKKSIDSKLESLHNVIQFHQLALDDPDLLSHVKDSILNTQLTAEAAVTLYFDQLIQLYHSKNDFFKARTIDFVDIRNRIINALKYPYYDQSCQKKSFDRPTILVYDIVYPNELTQINYDNVIGIISLRGSLHSHASIVLKSMNIPFIVGLNAVNDYQSGTYIRISLSTNEITVLSEEFHKAKMTLETAEKFEILPNISLHPALNLVDEIPEIIPKYWSSIGLFRTEMIFMDKPYLPDEIEQYLIYRNICEKTQGIRVRFRLIDVEPDKLLPAVESPLYGIELLLNHETLLSDQLRALLALSAKYPIGITVPMIETQHQIDAIKKVIDNIVANEYDDLSKKHLDYRFGIMVERKQAVTDFNQFHGIDYILIGTNDLSSDYVKIGREDDSLKTSHYINTEMINDIKQLVSESISKNIEVILCGDAANLEETISTYMSIGITSFSPSPKNNILYQKTSL